MMRNRFFDDYLYLCIWKILGVGALTHTPKGIFHLSFHSN